MRTNFNVRLPDVDLTEKVVLSITAHIVRTSRGNGGIEEREVLEAVEKMNQDFGASGLGFEVCKFKYIDKTRFYRFNKSDENLLVRNNEDSTVNLYFVNKIYSVEEGSICGYTYYPTKEKNYMIVTNSCLANRTTLSHEMGHFFGLYHTHEEQFGLELANGANCITAGDLVCDTSADPGLRFSNVSPNCEYMGLTLDPAKLIYNPPVYNLMSYSRKDCRRVFTQNQMEKMQVNYRIFKTGLKKIAIGFTVSDTLIVKDQPLVIKASGGERYAWNTGDSSALVVVLPDTSTLYSVNIYTNTGCVIYKQFFVEVIPEGIISAPEIVCRDEPAIVRVNQTKARLQYQLTLDGSWAGEPFYGTDSTLEIHVGGLLEDKEVGLLIFDELEGKVLQPQTVLQIKVRNVPEIPQQILVQNDTVCIGNYGIIEIPNSLEDVYYQIIQNGEKVHKPLMGTGDRISLITHVVAPADQFDLLVYNSCGLLVAENAFDVFVKEEPVESIDFSLENETVDKGEGTAITINNSRPGLFYYLVKDENIAAIHPRNLGRKMGNGNSLSFSTGPIHQNSVFCLYVVDEDGCGSFATEQVTIKVKEEHLFELERENDVYLFNYQLYKDARVKAEVRNLQGGVAAEIINGAREKGQHKLFIEAEALKLPAGSYLLLVTVDGTPDFHKIIRF